MSKYMIVSVGDPITGECTNVGVVVFGADDKYHSHRFGSFDRAIQRGDYPADDDLGWLQGFPESLRDIATVERRRGSTGYAMGYVRFSEICGSLLDPAHLREETFARFIKS